MIKPVIAVDFDDVVNDFNRAFLLYNRLICGETLTISYDDIRTYDYRITYGISQEEVDRRIWDFFQRFHSYVEPVDGALETLRLLNQRYGVHLVTGRCESVAEVTHYWLEKRVPGMFVATHFTNSFTTRHAERRRLKVDVCREINAVALIDDALAHAREVADTLQIPVYMPSRPWNKMETPPGVTRIDTFSEVIHHL